MGTPSGRKRKFSTTKDQESVLAAESKRTGKTEQAVFRGIVEEAFLARRNGAPGAGEARAAGLANLAQGAMSDYAVLYMLRRIMAALNLDPDELSKHPLAVASFLGGTECGALVGMWDRAGARLAQGEDALGAIAGACTEGGMSPGMLTGAAGVSKAPGKDGKGEPKGGGDAKRKRKRKPKR